MAQPVISITVNVEYKDGTIQRGSPIHAVHYEVDPQRLVFKPLSGTIAHGFPIQSDTDGILSSPWMGSVRYHAKIKSLPYSKLTTEEKTRVDDSAPNPTSAISSFRLPQPRPFKAKEKKYQLVEVIEKNKTTAFLAWDGKRDTALVLLDGVSPVTQAMSVVLEDALAFEPSSLDIVSGEWSLGEPETVAGISARHAANKAAAKKNPKKFDPLYFM